MANGDKILRFAQDDRWHPALELFIALQRAALRRHDAQHDLLVLGQKTRRLETAGAAGVLLHEIGVDARVGARGSAMKS